MNETILNAFTEELKAKGRSYSTIIAYKKDLDQLFDYIAKDLPNTELQNVNSENLTRFISSISQSREFSPKTISRKINSLKTFYKFLLAKKIISTDYSIAVKHPKFEKKKQRILSSMEYRALRDVARNNLRTYTIIELLLQTGMRIGELARLNRSDILRSGSSIAISIAPYESYPARVIDLNDSAVAALENYLNKVESLKNADYLFYTKSGKSLLIRNIRSTIDALFNKAEIKDAKVNDIRNTFIVYQLNNGIKIDVLAEYVGHQKTITTQRYLELVTNKNAKETQKIISL